VGDGGFANKLISNIIGEKEGAERMKKWQWIVIVILIIVGIMLGFTKSAEKVVNAYNSKLEGNVFSNKIYKFQFNTPSGWYCVVSSTPKWKLVCPKKTPLTQGSTSERLESKFPSIFFNFEDAEYSSLDTITNRFIKLNKQQIPEFNILSKDKKVIDEFEAIELVYTGNLTMQGVSLGELKTKQIFLIRDNILYNFLFMSKADRYNEDIGEFNRLVVSLVFE